MEENKTDNLNSDLIPQTENPSAIRDQLKTAEIDKNSNEYVDKILRKQSNDQSQKRVPKLK